MTMSDTDKKLLEENKETVLPIVNPIKQEDTSNNKDTNPKFNKNKEDNTNSKNFNKKNSKFKPRFQNQKNDGFEEVVVSIRRVTKVTKGGRNFRFAAVVVVGNKKGKVGLGTGKANEVPTAIKKAVQNGKKNTINVNIINGTVPYEMLGKYCGGKVLIMPAQKGRGIIAGGPVRSIMELAGMQNVYTKSLGSKTPINMIRATLEGLKKMYKPEDIMALRNYQVSKEELNKHNNYIKVIKRNKIKKDDIKKDLKNIKPNPQIKEEVK